MQYRKSLTGRHFLLLLVAAAMLLPGDGAAAAESRPDACATPRTTAEPSVRYVLQAGLDPAERRLSGAARITWTNTSAVPAPDLQLHLYLNAFRNNRSTFLRRADGRHRKAPMEEGEWGWIDIESVHLGDGTDVTGTLRFIQPDDGNLEDKTVASLPLVPPVPPGGSVTVDIVYDARLPHAFARTGQKGNFYLVAQWYPKPGVFMGEDGWNCHQFHSQGEFFADFSHFDVTLTTPQTYVVGATGRQSGTPRENEDGSVSRRFLQDSVHDFAWTADPDFLLEQRTFQFSEHRDLVQEQELASVFGCRQSDLTLPDTEVSLLLQPEHRAQADRIFSAVFAALLHYGYWYGPYPYPQLTVVDPQHGARGAGGMEYPTFITIGSDWLSPASSLSPESVTIHEFGHQYWYGLVATDETEEAWLDEGFTTYSTGKVLDLAYGPRHSLMRIAGVPLFLHPLASLPSGRPRGDAGRIPRPASLQLPPLPWASPGAPALPLHQLGLPSSPVLAAFRDLPHLNALRHHPIGALEGLRPDYLAHPDTDRVAQPSRAFLDSSTYGVNAYRRPALVLHTLERVLGEQTMLRVMRTYHLGQRFRHPSGADFVRTAEEVSGRNLEWLLHPLLQGDGVLDYAVTEVSSVPQVQPAGVFGQGTGRKLAGGGVRSPGQPFPEEQSAEISPAYVNRVVVRRLGSVRVPVVVEMEYDRGPPQREVWDGADRWRLYEHTEDRQVVRATVDPDRTYVIDLDWANNRRAARPEPRPAILWSLRLLLWMQHVLAFYGGLA